MTELKVEADPAEVGFDPARLERIDQHFRRYVDDGRLPGWLVTVSRHGRLAHVGQPTASATSRRGCRSRPTRCWRIYSMTKPITSVAAMMLYEEGAFELTDPVSEFIPSFADVRVYAGGSRRQAGDRARHRADADLAPADPHRGPDLRLPPRAPGRRACTATPASSGARRAGMDLAAVLRRLGGAAAAVPARARSGTTRWPPTCSAGSSRWPPGSRLDEFFAERIFGPLGMTDTSFWVARPTSSGWPRSTRPAPADSSRRARRDGPRSPAPARSCPAAAGWSRRRPTTTGSPRCCCRGRRRARRRPAARPAHLAYMTRNHLPGGADLETFGRPLYAGGAVPRGRLRAGLRLGHRPGRGEGARQRGRVHLGRRGVDGATWAASSTAISASARPDLPASVVGAMGSGMPMAVAATFRRPGTQVVAFIGDGGALMAGNEIATAIQYGADPIM